MNIDQTVRAIKQLKIQGAHAVAVGALQALHVHVLQSRAATVDTLRKDILAAHTRLIHARPTEPFLRNVLRWSTADVSASTLRVYREGLLERIQEILSAVKQHKQHIVHYGAKKILKNSVVFTHCHSSTVTSILLEAHKQKKNIQVVNTETRPLFQGRLTAEELARAGIPVRQYVDSAAKIALRHADMMLIGADAIISEGGVVNKVGSALIAESAHHLQVPCYVATTSLKFDPATVFGAPEPLEKRYAQEVWSKPPKNVTIDNQAFECIDPEFVDGIITEFGVFAPEVIVEEIKKHYSWIF